MLAIGAGALASWASGARAQAPLEVGFVYVSPVGTSGWTFQHAQIEHAGGFKAARKRESESNQH